ncbi:hypothetical protein D3C73_1541470 [compost metagenome]
MTEARVISTKLTRKIFCRPTLSEIQPKNRLPRNRPIRAEAPIKPCQNASSCICGLSKVNAIPIRPRI